jgi:hypothetical protein
MKAWYTRRSSSQKQNLTHPSVTGGPAAAEGHSTSVEGHPCIGRPLLTCSPQGRRPHRKPCISPLLRLFATREEPNRRPPASVVRSSVCPKEGGSTGSPASVRSSIVGTEEASSEALHRSAPRLFATREEAPPAALQQRKAILPVSRAQLHRSSAPHRLPHESTLPRATKPRKPS